MNRNLLNKYTAVTIVLFVMSGVAQAQVEPFRVKGSGILEYLPTQVGVGAIHTAEGQATHLGRYSGFSIVTPRQFNPTNPLTADFDSEVPFEFTAKNGDTLAYDYGRGPAGFGEVTLFDNGDGTFYAVFVAEFTLVPALTSGRRFRDLVDSSFIMVAITDDFGPDAFSPIDSPGIPYSWHGEGTIEFDRGK